MVLSIMAHQLPVSFFLSLAMEVKIAASDNLCNGALHKFLVFYPFVHHGSFPPVSLSGAALEETADGVDVRTVGGDREGVYAGLQEESLKFLGLGLGTFGERPAHLGA